LSQSAKTPYPPDINYGPEFFQRGQWLDRLPAIDQDTGDLRQLLEEPAGMMRTRGAHRDKTARR